MLPGQRHLCSGILTPLPRQDFSHHTILSSFLSSAGRSWFSRWLGRKWSKSATFVLKLSRRPGREEGGERSESNERWQRIQMVKKQSGWKKKRETAGWGGGREVRERARGKRRNVEGRARNGGAATFQLQHTQTTKTQISRDYNSLQPGGRSSFSLLHFSYPFSTQITIWNI